MTIKHAFVILFFAGVFSYVNSERGFDVIHLSPGIEYLQYIGLIPPDVECLRWGYKRTNVRAFKLEIVCLQEVAVHAGACPMWHDCRSQWYRYYNYFPIACQRDNECDSTCKCCFSPCLGTLTCQPAIIRHTTRNGTTPPTIGTTRTTTDTARRVLGTTQATVGTTRTTMGTTRTPSGTTRTTIGTIRTAIGTTAPTTTDTTRLMFSTNPSTAGTNRTTKATTRSATGTIETTVGTAGTMIGTTRTTPHTTRWMLGTTRTPSGTTRTTIGTTRTAIGVATPTTTDTVRLMLSTNPTMAGTTRRTMGTTPTAAGTIRTAIGTAEATVGTTGLMIGTAPMMVGTTTTTEMAADLSVLVTAATTTVEDEVPVVPPHQVLHELEYEDSSQQIDENSDENARAPNGREGGVVVPRTQAGLVRTTAALLPDDDEKREIKSTDGEKEAVVENGSGSGDRMYLMGINGNVFVTDDEDLVGEGSGAKYFIYNKQKKMF